MIAFRVDANEEVASGHLMRCIAIAAECRQRGQECVFILAENREIHRLEERGFSYRVLNSRWNDMESELPALYNCLEEIACDRLVVDSYQVTPDYLKSLQQRVPVLYLDDMGLEQYEVSAVLRYGLSSALDKYTAKYRDSGVRAYVGTKYIPLREEFQNIQFDDRMAAGKKSVTEIMITTGGTDPCHVTVGVLKAGLRAERLRDCRYHVIVGSMNHDKEDLQRLADEAGNLADGQPQIVIYDYVSHMSELMCRCDLAVSAGGTTLYELCACGTPTVCFSFADNQTEGVEELEKRDIIQYAGDARRGDVVTEICRQLQRLMLAPALRRHYTGQMKKLVDGMGVSRIADIIDSL